MPASDCIVTRTSARCLTARSAVVELESYKRCRPADEISERGAGPTNAALAGNNATAAAGSHTPVPQPGPATSATTSKELQTAFVQDMLAIDPVVALGLRVASRSPATLEYVSIDEARIELSAFRCALSLCKLVAPLGCALGSASHLNDARTPVSGTTPWP